MSISKQQYDSMVKKISPNSKSRTDILKAFLIGGLICSIGQGLLDIYSYFGFDEKSAAAWTSVTLVFLSALLTGLGIYEKIAKHAGAGTLVPITGFANAVASPALEFKAEGFILGVGAKIFAIAGPVILYGTAASVVYGLIYYLFLR
ncbi:MAG: stage V sporulation protein AC [Oscillospiraceae bacterium]|nr:stage V sporulation protein AC [Oscillospiraceae bacterium]